MTFDPKTISTKELPQRKLTVGFSIGSEESIIEVLTVPIFSMTK